MCMELDACLDEMVGKVIQREKYVQYNQLDDIHDVILVYINNETVGCGSYKRYSVDTAEMKRIFLREKLRGKGIAREMLRRLEEDAKLLIHDLNLSLE